MFDSTAPCVKEMGWTAEWRFGMRCPSFRAAVDLANLLESMSERQTLLERIKARMFEYADANNANIRVMNTAADWRFCIDVEMEQVYNPWRMKNNTIPLCMHTV